VWGALRCKANCNSVGTPSLPLNSIQYNNAGTFFGDFAFTRDPITKDTVIAKLFTNDEVGVLQITDSKGSAQISYNNTVTGEKALIAAGGGGVSGQIAVEISYEDGANLLSDLVLNSSGNTITWDADTTDTITTKLEQSQDILGLGLLSGSALTWQDTGTEILGFVGAVDGSGAGLFPGTAMIATSSVTPDASAIIATNYDNVNNITTATANVANGDFDSGFNFDDANAHIQYKNGIAGLDSSIRLDANSVITAYTLDGTTEYQTVLGDGTFQILNSTTNDKYLSFDVTTGIYEFGDVDAAVNGAKLTVDDSSQKIVVSGARFLDIEGSDLAATNALVLGNVGNTFVVFGNTQINTLSTAGWQQGSEVVLQFTGTPTIKHMNGSASPNLQFSLAGSVDLVVATKTTVTFRWMGDAWQETSRVVQ
jgi:hypothetical protein